MKEDGMYGIAETVHFVPQLYARIETLLYFGTGSHFNSALCEC